MPRPIDRRTFLATAGAGGVVLAAGPAARVLADGLRPGVARAPVPSTLRQAMRGPIINRGSPGFAAAAHVYNERFDAVAPATVARPLSTADVQGAIRWAVGHGVAVRARAGGHSYAGYSTLRGGLVLDLRNLAAISVNRAAGTATIGAGAQLIDVYTALAAKGATIPAGSCPSVGIGGHAMGGGIGLAGRAFGLTLDNLIAAEVVTADGRIRQVSRKHDPDLLWALRGAGGGNFGVVTQLQFRLHRAPSRAAWFFVYWPWSQASQALAAWQAWAPHTSDSFSSVFHLQTGPGGPQVLVGGQYIGSAAQLGRLLAPLTAVAGSRLYAGAQDYQGLQVRWANCLRQSLPSCHTAGTRPGGRLPRASFDAKSDYVAKPLNSAGRATLISAIDARQGQAGSAAILCDAYGGAINRVKPSATAFVHRSALFCLQYYLADTGSGGWLGATHARMRPHVSGMAYQNYIDPTLKGWQQAYYGANYSRLLAVRERYDPEHRFTFPQAIGR